MGCGAAGGAVRAGGRARECAAGFVVVSENRRRFGPRRGMGRLLRSWRHGPAALCRLSYRSTRSPSGTRTRDHLEDVENRAVPARSSHVSVEVWPAGLEPALSGFRRRRGAAPPRPDVALLPLHDVCAARPPFGPGPPRAGRGVLRGGVLEPGISPCYCRKMTAEHRGSDCTAVKSDGATKEPFSLRRGLGSVAMRCSSQASPGGGRCGLAVVVRATKRATLWVALACSGFSAAVRLTHRPPDEGVLVVRQAVEAAERHDGRDDGHANRHAQTGAIRNRRGECRAQAQGRDVGVETHEVVLVASLREYKPVSGRAQAFHGEFSVCVTSLHAR